MGTAILLGDGAGATLIGKSEEEKLYASKLESDGRRGNILTYDAGKKITMDGKAIYKYAVTDTVKNIEDLLLEQGKTLEEITYFVPHQSNLRILQKIAKKLGVSEKKMYSNIQQIGNTFCASIPIALNEIMEQKMVKSNNILILFGYGGGLNLGSIMIEL